MFNNFWLYWLNRRKKEINRRESFKEERGRSWDRFSQTSDTEVSRGREKKWENRIRTNRTKREEHKTTNWRTEGRNNIQDQDSEGWTEHIQRNNTYVEDILGQIWERLEKLEEAREMARGNLANHF
jgi:hypothetical protein